MLNFHAVPIEIPDGANLIIGQSHFIKTVEDLYEALVNTVPQMKFGIAFNEASGQCLVRSEGNDTHLRAASIKAARAIGAGHIFVVLMREGFPINVLTVIQMVPEVCSIFCATANPVEVVIAETAQGRGIMGVVDGFPPKGVETAEDVTKRHEFLRNIGYKR